MSKGDHPLYIISTFEPHVFISYSCSNGSLQTWWLKTTNLPSYNYGSQSLKVQKSGCGQGWFLPEAQPLLLPASGSRPTPRLLPALLQSLLPLSMTPLPHGPSFPLEREPCDYVDGPLTSSRWTSACEVEASRKVSEDLKVKPVSWTFLKKLERLIAFTIGSWPREKSKPINDRLLPGKGLGSSKMTGTLDTCKDPGAGVPQRRRVVLLGKEDGAEGRTRRGRSWAGVTLGMRRRGLEKLIFLRVTAATRWARRPQARTCPWHGPGRSVPRYWDNLACSNSLRACLSYFSIL